jgi:hypothetical protein
MFSDSLFQLVSCFSYGSGSCFSYGCWFLFQVWLLVHGSVMFAGSLFQVWLLVPCFSSFLVSVMVSGSLFQVLLLVLWFSFGWRFLVSGGCWFLASDIVAGSCFRHGCWLVWSGMVADSSF